MLMSIILLINYSLYLPKHICMCFFPYLIFHILCFIYLNCALPRLAMLFAVCSYPIFVFYISMTVNGQDIPTNLKLFLTSVLAETHFTFEIFV